MRNSTEKNKIYYAEYREKNRLLLNERSKKSMQENRKSKITKKRINCKACNKQFWTIRASAKYCESCNKLVNKITNKVSREKSQIHNFDISETEIEVSDFVFQTDLCDQDCSNCKYDDCILPEED